VNTTIENVLKKYGKDNFKFITKTFPNDIPYIHGETGLAHATYHAWHIVILVDENDLDSNDPLVKDKFKKPGYYLVKGKSPTKT